MSNVRPFRVGDVIVSTRTKTIRTILEVRPELPYGNIAYYNTKMGAVVYTEASRVRERFASGEFRWAWPAHVGLPDGI